MFKAKAIPFSSVQRATLQPAEIAQTSFWMAAPGSNTRIQSNSPCLTYCLIRASMLLQVVDKISVSTIIPKQHLYTDYWTTYPQYFMAAWTRVKGWSVQSRRMRQVMITNKSDTGQFHKLLVLRRSEDGLAATHVHTASKHPTTKSDSLEKQCRGRKEACALKR